MGKLDILQQIAEHLTRLDPQAEAQAQARRNTADTLRERLFQHGIQQNQQAMEQQRVDLEKQRGESENTFRQNQEQHQRSIDEANRQHQQLIEQLGLSKEGYRPVKPSEAFPSTLGFPGLNIPSPDTGRPTVPDPYTGKPLVAPTPEEQGATAGRITAAKSSAENEAFQQEFDRRLSSMDPEWVKQNSDTLNQFRSTGGKFFPQDNTDPIKDLQRQYLAANTDDERNAIAGKITALGQAKTAGTAQIGKVIQPLNRDKNNMFNSGYDEDTLKGLAAQYAISGGDVASLGMMGAVPKQAVQKYSRELFPNADYATNKAVYGANKVAIDKQLQQFNNIASYENTGKGNLQRAMDILKTLPDAYSPFLNKPIREFEREIAGTPELTAFRTAILTARNEYSRITTGGPNMTGVVSDTARSEVGKALPENATLNQFLAAGNVALLDMEQRKHDQAHQLEFLTNNLSKGPEGLKNLAETSPAPTQLDYKTGKEIKPAGTNDTGTPPRPATIPPTARAQWSASRKAWRYSTDEGKTWQILQQ